MPKESASSWIEIWFQYLTTLCITVNNDANTKNGIQLFKEVGALYSAEPFSHALHILIAFKKCTPATHFK